MTARRLRFGIKVAQMGGTYATMQEAWLEADRLGFDTAWAHDHLLNQNDQERLDGRGLDIRRSWSSPAASAAASW